MRSRVGLVAVIVLLTACAAFAADEFVMLVTARPKLFRSEYFVAPA